MVSEENLVDPQIVTSNLFFNDTYRDVLLPSLDDLSLNSAEIGVLIDKNEPLGGDEKVTDSTSLERSTCTGSESSTSLTPMISSTISYNTNCAMVHIGGSDRNDSHANPPQTDEYKESITSLVVRVPFADFSLNTVGIEDSKNTGMIVNCCAYLFCCVTCRYANFILYHFCLSFF